MNNNFNEKLRQVLLLSLIISLSFILAKEFYVFLPGLMGGLTLYILTGNLYNELVFEKKWKKGLTAILFIVCCLTIIFIPVYFSIKMLSPRINSIIENPNSILAALTSFRERLIAYGGGSLLSEEDIISLSKKITSYLPGLINSTINLVTNLIMMFFIYYYLLTGGKSMEKYLRSIIPLKAENISELGHETRLLIRANALGIPLISFVQGVFAAIGYWIFGVEDWGLWGFFTGIFAFFPLVGTMLIWVPIVISEFIAGHAGMAIGLGIYSLIVTGNVDYITRLLFMKKIGNIHPLITIFGVIAGLGLFGFMGLIFGPLLMSYLIVLIKIYLNEFTVIRNPEA